MTAEREQIDHLTRGRYGPVRLIARQFAYAHLPPHLQEISAPFNAVMRSMLDEIQTDSDELIAGLRLLRQAKDSMVLCRLDELDGPPPP